MKPERIEVKEGNILVPIYKFSDGRYCVDTMLGTKRKRIVMAIVLWALAPLLIKLIDMADHINHFFSK